MHFKYLEPSAHPLSVGGLKEEHNAHFGQGASLGDNRAAQERIGVGGWREAAKGRSPTLLKGCDI